MLGQFRNVGCGARAVKGEKSKNDPFRAVIDPMRSHRGNAQDGFYGVGPWPLAAAAIGPWRFSRARIALIHWLS